MNKVDNFNSDQNLQIFRTPEFQNQETDSCTRGDDGCLRIAELHGEVKETRYTF